MGALAASLGRGAAGAWGAVSLSLLSASAPLDGPRALAVRGSRSIDSWLSPGRKGKTRVK